jgi:hypothetical protein
MMEPAVSSPEVEWKCKGAVKPLLPPGRVRGRLNLQSVERVPGGVHRSASVLRAVCHRRERVWSSVS